MASARNAARAPHAPRRPVARPRPRAVQGGRRASAIRWDRVGRFMMLVVVLFVAALYVHPLLSIWSTRGEAAKRRAEVVRLQTEQDRLARRVKALQSPTALEREARRLGMVRPGERAYVIEGLPQVGFETAIQQWRQGERHIDDAAPEQLAALHRVEEALIAELRRRLGGAFTVDELVTLYDDGTGWCLDLATRVAPRAPWSWDARVADAAFARYVRSAIDYAGGRRLQAPG